MIPDVDVKCRGIEWAAGLFEGEGCISLWRSKQKNGAGQKEYLGLRLQLAMTDEDVVREFHRIAEIGTVYVQTSAKAQRERNGKVLFIWQSQGKESIDFVWKMVPYFLSRRRERFLEAWLEVNEAKERGWAVEA